MAKLFKSKEEKLADNVRAAQTGLAKWHNTRDMQNEMKGFGGQHDAIRTADKGISAAEKDVKNAQKALAKHQEKRAKRANEL